MADTKISALTSGSPAALSDLLVVARAGANKSLSVADVLGGAELDYVSRTTSLTVSATSAATANTSIDGSAVSYDGSTRVKIEVFTPLLSASSGQAGVLELYDGSTDVGVIVQLGDTSNGPLQMAMYGVYFVTPSNASHTFHVKAWKTGGTVAVSGNTGGAGVVLAAWMRITKA